MTKAITESQVEEAALEILSELGYDILNGPVIVRQMEIILSEKATLMLSFLTG
jgi:hypothetical protein